MLEDLKKEQAGMSAQERTRLALYVAGLLLLGALIVSLTLFPGDDGAEEPTPAETPAPADDDAADDGAAGDLDPAALEQAVRSSGAEPYRWAVPGIVLLEDVRLGGRLPPVSGRPSPAELAALEPAAARGRTFVVRGRVVGVTSESFERPGAHSASALLWAVTFRGADGTTCVVIKLGDESDVRQGAPTLATRLGSARRPVEIGQHLLVRGVYLQRRSGTLGETMLGQSVPVLYATDQDAFRITLPPEEMLAPIADLAEADWDAVGDRFLGQTQKWDEPALFQTLQWAQAVGHERIAAALASGELPWSDWNQETFETWKQEVDVDEDAPRPFTEGARGRVFRLGGLIGDVIKMGWAQLPPNRYGIDEALRADILADHYLNRALRVWTAFEFSDFEGVEGRRSAYEHVRFYGVFVKNLTYRAIQKDRETEEYALISVPMFVVLHMEPHPETSPMAAVMWWVAGAMVLFGLLFYFVLIRGNRKQVAAMEAQRQRMRERRRAHAREKGATPAPGEDGSPPDAAPPDDAPPDDAG